MTTSSPQQAWSTIPLETKTSWLETAVTLAKRAAAVVHELQHTDVEQSRKADKSVVTEADLRSDAILRKGLQAACPEHALLTEEGEFDGNPDSRFVWVVDPLDGTKAFIKGTDDFCVMVGLLCETWPVLGVVVEPVSGRCYGALRGQGTWLEVDGKREPVKVSEREDASAMPLVTSHGFPDQAFAQLHTKFGLPRHPRTYSVGVKVGVVVRQEADIYISHHPLSYWDTCAPMVILEEAGGSFTDIEGQALTYNLHSKHVHEGLLLVTNGRVRERWVDTLRSDMFS